MTTTASSMQTFTVHRLRWLLAIAAVLTITAITAGLEVGRGSDRSSVGSGTAGAPSAIVIEDDPLVARFGRQTGVEQRFDIEDDPLFVRFGNR